MEFSYEIPWFVQLVVYVYFAVCLYLMAKKLSISWAWTSWIPIVNMFLMLKVAKKPMWWFILMLIPLVNIVIFIIVFMNMAKNLGKPSWWGILMIIPGLNLIALGYLAFSSGGPAKPLTPPAAPAV